VTVRRIVPHVRSADLAASRSFYEGFLGLDVAMDMGWILTFASPANPTAKINVVDPSRSPAPSPDVTVEVPDVDAVHARARARDLPVVRPLADEPWAVRRFFLADPSGRVVNVMTHREPGGR